MCEVCVGDSSHERSCAYFDPQVLLRYTGQPDKYLVEDSYIKSKEEGWILQSLCYSSCGEVYCYLYDLSLLPEKEQAHWRPDNLEDPEGTESSLARERDFFCSFDNSTKQELVCVLKNLGEMRFQVGDTNLVIWSPREDFDQMVNEVVLPLTEENKQYRDGFLLPLARLVIEGFEEKKLKKIAVSLGVSIEKPGSLNALELFLARLCGDKKIAVEVLKPLRDLQNEKSARASHGGKEREKTMVTKANSTLAAATESIAAILQIIKNR